jgi:hypothetical protein
MASCLLQVQWCLLRKGTMPIIHGALRDRRDSRSTLVTSRASALVTSSASRRADDEVVDETDSCAAGHRSVSSSGLNHRRRGGRHRRGVGWSRSHAAGIRPRPSHIPHGASQDHWRGSAPSRRHSKCPRPPHPGQGTLGGPPPSRACGRPASASGRPSRLLRGAGRLACRWGPTAVPPPDPPTACKPATSPLPHPTGARGGTSIARGVPHATAGDDPPPTLTPCA